MQPEGQAGWLTVRDLEEHEGDSPPAGGLHQGQGEGPADLAEHSLQDDWWNTRVQVSLFAILYFPYVHILAEAKW